MMDTVTTAALNSNQQLGILWFCGPLYIVFKMTQHEYIQVVIVPLQVDDNSTMLCVQFSSSEYLIPQRMVTEFVIRMCMGQTCLLLSSVLDSCICWAA